MFCVGRGGLQITQVAGVSDHPRYYIRQFSRELFRVRDIERILFTVHEQNRPVILLESGLNVTVI
ncbi:hypothetical protein DJ74_15750 [Halorubrum sp. Ea8]|nr:hypothetical protein DJ74_15750 [Halorubrum sp. Ea8]